MNIERKVKLTSVVVVNGREYSTANPHGIKDARMFSQINWSDKEDARKVYSGLMEAGLDHSMALRITECEVSQIVGHPDGSLRNLL